MINLNTVKVGDKVRLVNGSTMTVEEIFKEPRYGKSYYVNRIQHWENGSDYWRYFPRIIEVLEND